MGEVGWLTTKTRSIVSPDSLCPPETHLLASWINRYLTVALFAWALWLPVRLGHSVVGVFNRSADRVVVGVLRKWHQAWVHRNDSPQ